VAVAFLRVLNGDCMGGCVLTGSRGRVHGEVVKLEVVTWPLSTWYDMAVVDTVDVV